MHPKVFHNLETESLDVAMLEAISGGEDAVTTSGPLTEGQVQYLSNFIQQANFFRLSTTEIIGIALEDAGFYIGGWTGALLSGAGSMLGPKIDYGK